MLVSVFAVIFPVVFAVIAAVILAVVALLAVHIDFVEDTSEDLAACLDELVLHGLGEAVADGPGRQDEDGSVAFFPDDRGVDDASERRGIHDHVIVPFPGLLQELRERVAVQQFTGRRGRRARQHDVEAPLIGLTDGILHAALADQVIGEAVPDLAGADVFAHDRLAKVGVDHQYVVLVLGKGPGELEGDLRFALIGRTARDRDGADVLAAEFNVGAEGLVSLSCPEGQIVVVQIQLLHDQFSPFPDSLSSISSPVPYS